MATTEAVSAVCKTIVHVLQTEMQDPETPAKLRALDPPPKFAVYSSSDFIDVNREITSGASVFLYRVLPNLTHRTPARTISANGQRQLTKLPLDLQIIVTIWGKDSDTQNHLVAWVLRTLEDYPIIPASILNIVNIDNPVFDEDESIELVLGELPGEELLHLWDLLGVQGSAQFCYQISIPYLVRNVYIDSRHERESTAPVQVRTWDMQRLEERER
jgi:hypothetical protein